MRRLLAGILLAAVGSGLKAQPADVFTLEPTLPAAGEPVRLRVDGADGCYRAEGSRVTREGPFIDLRIDVSDIGNCSPEWVTPLFFGLGTFPAGDYFLRIVECGFAPVPCSVRETIPLRVAARGQSQVRAIPALSDVASAALAALLVAFGWLGAMRLRGM